LMKGDGRLDAGDHKFLQRALEEFVVTGVKTTIPLHQKLVDNPEFLAGDYTIKWLEQWLARDADA